ncbi:pyridoxal phosphate-dependent aminotransferase [Bacillus glycinifermentans]|uniref:Aminotransferase class I/II-fold pyridoxal phosphate-dependent enzyme n=1 Tax=Bacillus glycinifermentans TaxID=1664069 RepID=A0A0J6EM05_9BACI|nr:aminotransferase class I/II-fold pyridoxal phosphate-dependent enzyme [Bacillus glycinifermentans]ATH93256.1 pyridoxal phosphate-dependent aminotransferase [Bacillus glycinifermentans]KMM58368.1 pyridoxal phosphate-dependent aminotransferase [Bacillus glycinifermentans]KRT88364.1 pyridoxal phosphate-dependent aminotransferase [Bacillus glycinifermentans]MEC0483324.1 aminotransferase class I/II-fold pyridoxal phosphate-dependent enzyme [Bacillus glycinifermentans]MEC0493746.1 aminotransferas
MDQKKRIYLSPPHMSGEEERYVAEAFRTNWIAPLGPLVDAFEEKLASYAGTAGAAAVSSGTAAIHLALKLLGAEKGDKVFCSTFTFVASANPVLYEQAEPVFIDSEPDTWNMSPEALERALDEAERERSLPKAVIVVNLYGQSAKMDEIISICDKYAVPVIEDAAESLGSEYKGRKSGTFGRFGIYSFNGNKIITTSGGGMLVSDDEEALQRARFLATQAREPAVHYQHEKAGFNYRMSNVLAGIGIAQLGVLDDRVKARRAVFKRYQEALSDIAGIDFMPEIGMSNRWLTTLTFDAEKIKTSPADIIEQLARENIEARPLWKPLHRQPLFKGAAFYAHDETRPVADDLFERGLCLPSGSSLTIEEQDRIIQVLCDRITYK